MGEERKTPTKSLGPLVLPESLDGKTLTIRTVHLRLKGLGWEKISRALRKDHPDLTPLAAYAIKLRVREAERKVGIGRGGETVRI